MAKQQIVYGEVYAPNRPDAQGEFMTAETIRKMAHEFLKEGKTRKIDLMHDNQIVGSAAIVESFVAPVDSKAFIPESWVIGMHIEDPKLWARVEKGELNGFSMEAVVSRHEKEVELEIPPVITGRTSKSEVDQHEHTFYVTYDEQGQFKGGVTDTVNGHFHQILAGTHTQEAAGHTHRFSAVDNVQIVVN